MQPEHENKMINSSNENKGEFVIDGKDFKNEEAAKAYLKKKLHKTKKQKDLMDRQLQSQKGQKGLPCLDAFGNKKPKTGHGSLNRHERRKRRKLAKKQGI